MKLSTVGIAAIAALGLSAAANAGQVRVVDGVGGLNGQEGSGGAFQVQIISGFNGYAGGPGGSATAFSSFCLERNENVSLGSFYNTTIATSAINGGYGGGSPDPVGEATAWLYRTFRDGGSIAGHVVDGVSTSGGLTPNELVSALQLAIWRAEDEIMNTATWDNLGNANVRTAALAMYNAAIAAAASAPGEFYGVRVLRLYTLGGDNSQDQLTLVPLPPAGWAGLSTLAGAGLVGYIRRRKQLN